MNSNEDGESEEQELEFNDEFEDLPPSNTIVGGRQTGLPNKTNHGNTATILMFPINSNEGLSQNNQNYMFSFER